MTKTKRNVFLAVAMILFIFLPVFFGCENNQDNEPGQKLSPPPEGSNGFPETLTMGVPFDLRKGITVNLPLAPNKTVDDIIWARTNNGDEFQSYQVVIEDDLFIPITFFTTSVKVYAIIKDGDGEGFDHIKEFTINIDFPLNPFIGSWQGSDGKTWLFRKNGTYGIDGSSNNTGSFAVWSGKPGRKFLVTVTGDPDAITVESVADKSSGLYQPYSFVQTDNTIKITPIEFDYHAVNNKQDPNSFEETGPSITLTRQSGEPAALEMSHNDNSNIMIGVWNGSFAATEFNFSTGTTVGNSTITYYADGRVQQNYEGAWLKRGAVFVIVGNDGRRWDPPALASWDKGTATAMENKEVVRIHEYRPNGAGEPYSRQTNTSLFWRLTKSQ